MSNKIKLNKRTGELFIYSPSSIEDRAIIIKKVDGILSFPIKVETMKGNKEDEEKVIYGLYYEDTLLEDNVLLLTYENRDDAIATRKAIEKAYFKNDKDVISTTLKVVMGIVVLLVCGKYLLSTNVVSMPNQQKQMTPDSLSNPHYDRNAIMKSVEQFKEKQKNEKNTLQEEKSNDSINQTSDTNNNVPVSTNDEVKTQGQEFADFLNGKK